MTCTTFTPAAYAVIAAICIIGPRSVSAAAPLFSAKCPIGLTVDSDDSGTVFVNGKPAKVINRPDGQITAQYHGNYIDITPRGEQAPQVTYTARDKSVGECEILSFGGADDGEGAMAGSGGQHGGGPTTETERVRFSHGMTGTELKATLTPGSSVRYILNAKNEQFLHVHITAHGPDIHYQIFNPDNSFLLDQISADRDYKGQLWQSGDHVIEVINRGHRTTSFNVRIGID